MQGMGEALGAPTGRTRTTPSTCTSSLFVKPIRLQRGETQSLKTPPPAAAAAQRYKSTPPGVSTAADGRRLLFSADDNTKQLQDGPVTQPLGRQ
jgi:hypothetical protein